MSNPSCVRLIRVYDAVQDGSYRVLVDRLWPRGVSKGEAAIDEWLKDVAPTAALRQWYGHDVERFAAFDRRYRAELLRAPASVALAHLRSLIATRPVCLVTATRDVEHSGAQVLMAVLDRSVTTSRPRRAPRRLG